MLGNPPAAPLAGYGGRRDAASLQPGHSARRRPRCIVAGIRGESTTHHGVYAYSDVIAKSHRLGLRVS